MVEVKDRSGLVKRFEKAGLEVELTSRPMMGAATGPGSNAFQMDINRPKTAKGPREIFRIWPGHDGNRLEVIGTNDDLQQAVLMVKEPKRTIEIEIPGWQVARFKAGNPDRPVFQRNGRFFYTQDTPEAKRHYLMGMDERHYFVCQLPRPATTVQDAHRVLKNETVA